MSEESRQSRNADEIPHHSHSHSKSPSRRRAGNVHMVKANSLKKIRQNHLKEESDDLFELLDADHSNTVGVKEVTQLLMQGEFPKVQEKIDRLIKTLGTEREATAFLISKVAIELATGKHGQEAIDAEMTKDQFHRFRKKYLLDELGIEEVYERAVFENFDPDGNGELDSDELEKFLTVLYSHDDGKLHKSRHMSFSIPQMKEIILDSYDVNGDETISFGELRSVISGGVTALEALHAMKLEKDAAKAKKREKKEKERLEKEKKSSGDDDGDEDDDDEEEDDDDDEEEEEEEETSAEVAARNRALRLLSMLETPEEKAQKKAERERLESIMTTELGELDEEDDEDSDDEDDDDEEEEDEETLDMSSSEEAEEEKISEDGEEADAAEEIVADAGTQQIRGDTSIESHHQEEANTMGPDKNPQEPGTVGRAASLSGNDNERVGGEEQENVQDATMHQISEAAATTAEDATEGEPAQYSVAAAPTAADATEAEPAQISEATASGAGATVAEPLQQEQAPETAPETTPETTPQDEPETEKPVEVAQHVPEEKMVALTDQSKTSAALAATGKESAVKDSGAPPVDPTIGIQPEEFDFCLWLDKFLCRNKTGERDTLCMRLSRHGSRHRLNKLAVEDGSTEEF